MRVSSIKPFKLAPNILFLLSIIILGFILRIYRLDYKSVWLDEVVSIFESEEGIQYIISAYFPLLYYTSLFPRVAPLYYIILHYFLYFGKSEFVVRLPAVIFGVLAILLVYKVGEVFFGKREGLISAFLLSISTMHIHYSQEARMYSLFMFLALFSLFLFYKATKENSRKLWIGFILSTMLGILSHYYMLFILLIEGVFFVFVLIMGMKKVDEKKTLLFILVLVLISIFLLPLFKNVLDLLNTSGVFYVPWGLEPTSFFEDLFSYFSFNFPSPFLSYLYGRYIGASFLYVFLLFFLLGILTSIKERKEQTILLLLWVFLPAAIVFIISLTLGSPIADAKYMIFVLPGYLVGISRGISTIANSLLRYYYKVVYGFSSIPLLERRQSVISLAITMVVMVAFAGVSVAPLQEYYKSENENWRAVAKYLETNSSPGDIIFVEPDYTAKCLLYYYNADFHFFNLGMKDVLSSYERIWFIYSSHAKWTDQEGKIKDWVLSNFFEAKRFTGISIYFKLPEGTILVRTKDMRFVGLDSPPNETEAEFWHNDDSASFNVNILKNANYTIAIYAKSAIKSALELMIDGSSKGIVTFNADDWSSIELGTFYFDSGSHEIKLVNREGGDLGDTNVVFDRVIILPTVS